MRERREARRGKARGRGPRFVPASGPRPPAAVLLCLLLSAFCLPPSRAQTETAEVHRWGAVTLFHGLPSEQVRAVAQDADGVMWFGTDAGLARYDGLRIQTVGGEGLSSRRVRALRLDAGGALWAGTDNGAFVRAAGEEAFRPVNETKGKAVTALATPAAGRAYAATSDGLLFECLQAGGGGPPRARQVGAQLTGAAAGSPPVELTSLAVAGETLVVGTRGRGLVTVSADGEAKEVISRPRPFFIEAIARDPEGALLFGTQTSAGDSGLYRVEGERLARPAKVAAGATGTVTALAFTPEGDLYAGSDGRGVFHRRAGSPPERFTFAGTAGGLRSDRVNAVFVDREGVVWFGTDRGVCRYDPQGVRVEQLSPETEGNFVRSLHRTARGRLLAGTNRGLFVRDEGARAWRPIPEVSGKTVYAVAEDRRGRLLVGTSAGLYVGLQADARAPDRPVKLAPEEEQKKADEPKKAAGDTKDAAAPPAAGEEARPPTAAGDAGTGAGAAAGAGEKPSAGGQDEKADEGDDKAAVRKTPEPALSGSVRAIAAFGDAVYVATFGRGLERFEGPGRRTLVWPREGGDERGREVVSLYADERAGRLWVGTANAGAYYFDGREVRAEPALAALGTSTVWGMAVADGLTWLATSRGLYVQRAGGPVSEVIRGVDARGVALIESAGGPARAWCATAGSGVVKVLLDERFGPVVSGLDVEQGLPTQSAFAVLTYGAGEGERGETLLVGTTRGLARYRPGRHAPALRLTRVTASRTHQPEELRGGPLRLDYPENGLVVDVAASASRTFPEQFQYAFVLEDARGRVVKQALSHESEFQAESLAAGLYRVTVRAYTRDLLPSEPLRFEFEVARAPFPWTILSLSVLLALALVALLWGSFQHRRIVRGGEELREVNRQLAAARLQLANEAETERRRIARDLHDQTLADLRRLLLLTDEMQQAAPVGAGAGLPAAAANVSAADPSVLRAEIEAVSQEIRRICEDLSPSVLENVGFAAALEFALTSGLAHQPADCRLAAEFACDEGLDERLSFAPAVQMQVYRIVQEAVSNVCRHAQATSVRLTIRLDEAHDFVLTLEDDGSGIEVGNKKTRGGRGLSGIRARAGLIDAEVRWDKRPPDEGGGTVFTLRKAAKSEARP